MIIRRFRPTNTCFPVLRELREAYKTCNIFMLLINKMCHNTKNADFFMF
jgi:hypothetical protein